MGPYLWGLAYTGWVRKLVLPGCIGLALIGFCDRRIERVSKAHLFDRVQEVPYNRLGVVLGTSEKGRNGRHNPFFDHRINAALELYMNGKVDRLLLSGDNGTIHYNEPWAMRRALIAAGVDSTHITLDHAGFRTLDSMVRAREVFGQQSFTVISQRFHNERAVYIARRKGIDAIGYNARDVDAYSGFRTKLREKLARVKVFVDLILGVDPHFLGEPVTIE
jgi:SanA protein